MSRYRTIQQAGQAGFREKGSQFLGSAFPVGKEAEIREQLGLLRSQHPQASHRCYGWRLGIHGEQSHVRDDGEPPGTAGKPILSQIRSRDLTFIRVVVIRYFGGTRLGIEGLTRAYRTCSSLVLQLCPLVEKCPEISVSLEVDYIRYQEVMNLLRLNQERVIRAEQGIFCRLEVNLPEEGADPCLSGLSRICRVIANEPNRLSGPIQKKSRHLNRGRDHAM